MFMRPPSPPMFVEESILEINKCMLAPLTYIHIDVAAKVHTHDS